MDSSKSEFYIIGLMSGTSVDGIDLAYCRFGLSESSIKYEVIHCETVDYDENWKSVFIKLENANAVDFCEWDRKIGAFFGKSVADFLAKFQIEKLDFVASHGHTIFHQPEKGFTVQVGHGADLAAQSGHVVICDFRSKDVAMGGNGAPLVPIGDRLLFPNYKFCLNLGGFANISFQNQHTMIAFDIVAANIVLNFYAQKLGIAYDEEGKLAASGKVNLQILNELNSLPFYKKEYPKSLGKEWVMAEIFPILEKYSLLEGDILASYCEHIAIQISKVVLENSNLEIDTTMLVTGGGAFNKHLMQLIVKKLAGKCQVIIPDENTVKFKEAIIFALLGLLRIKNIPNCLKSVTGASIDNIGGCIYL